MAEDRTRPLAAGDREGRGTRWLAHAPWLTLLASLLVTLVVFAIAWSRMHTEAHGSFERRAHRIERLLGERLSRCQHLLVGARSLFMADGAVHRHAWHAYVDGLALQPGYPGVTGLGFVARVPSGARAAFLADARGDLAPGFAITPPPGRAPLDVVRIMEPEGHHLAWLGFDLATLKPLAAALDRAADLGEARLTGPVRLPSGPGRETEVALFLPVYRTGTTPPSVAERRAALTGWVVGVVSVPRLVSSLGGELPSSVGFEILDGPPTPFARRLLSRPLASGASAGDPAMVRETSTLHLGGREWTLRAWGDPLRGNGVDRALPFVVLALGGVVSLLLTGLALALASSRARALALAQRMTESLRATESEARKLALIASRTDNLALVLDPDSRIEWANDGFTRVTGYTLDEARGRRPSEFLLGPGTDPETLARMDAEMGDERVFKGELLHYAKSGAELWLGLECQPIHDETGRLVHFTVIQTDLTDRRRVEEQLRLSGEILRRVGSLVLVADSEGRITYASPSVKTVLGYAPEEVLGDGWWRLTRATAEERERERRLSAQSARGERPEEEATYERLIRRADGSPAWVLWHDATLPGGFVVGVGNDITARKRAEEDLVKATEAALEASRVKSEFLANMSHEIRTPMNGVIGMVELLLDTDLDPEQREFADMARSSAHGLLTIINDILDFSKIEAGKLDLERIAFSLRDNLSDTLKPLGFRAHQKGLELALDIDPATPDAMLGDPGRLRQVLINLVGNAIKFTEQGEIVVRVAPERVDEGEATLHLVVSDTGIGIPEDKQGAVFGAFTQADGSMTRRYGGTGLGLAIAMRLVQMMGGRIWVESAPGAGSAFHVEVRLGVSDRLDATPAPRELDALQDLRALVVDDHATNRRIIEAMLSGWGLRVATATNAEEALAALRRGAAAGTPFALLVTDAQMPGEDGFGLAARIREDAALTGLAIVMLTSSGQSGDGARCRELGVAGYLAKPVSSGLLQETVRAVLGEPRTDAPAALVTRHSLREGRRGLHVLLAEDNPVNRRVAVHLLERRGHHVVAVADGREAVEATAREAFDLVLMDVQMPVLDGLEATARIRAREQAGTPRTHIVALTAHAMKGDAERCIEAGMDGYLSKPIQVAELEALIERCGARAAADDDARPRAA